VQALVNPGVLIGWKFDLALLPLFAGLGYFVWPWLKRHFAPLERESEVIRGCDERTCGRRVYDWACEEHLVYEIEKRRDGPQAALERRFKRMVGLYSYEEPDAR
jgi:hypothetical protein